MRALTKKQKTLITKWFKNSGNKVSWETHKHYSLNSVKDLTYEQWKILVDINDTEILYQNINAFIDDLHEIELAQILN
ncbi:MAG: hypothetical protein E3J83_04290 [Candidatus Atribacteria bacterium]|nr:MAG: hypothetical protein E3J83_04290 [Candidatus Atribacteria bacterium]